MICDCYAATNKIKKKNKIKKQVKREEDKKEGQAFPQAYELIKESKWGPLSHWLCGRWQW